RRRHTRFSRDWSSDVCSSDLGIAAVIASSDNDNDRYGRYNYGDNRRGYGNGYGSSRSAVEQCVYAAERTASRYSYGGGANVTDIDRKSVVEGKSRGRGGVSVG